MVEQCAQLRGQADAADRRAQETAAKLQQAGSVEAVLRGQLNDAAISVDEAREAVAHM